MSSRTCARGRGNSNSSAAPYYCWPGITGPHLVHGVVRCVTTPCIVSEARGDNPTAPSPRVRRIRGQLSPLAEDEVRDPQLPESIMRVLILLAILGAASAVPKQINRIVGGTPTVVQNYPYISNMQYSEIGFWWYQACGGSLVTANSVLSAAHCFYGDVAQQWRVRLGTSFASSGGTVHAISQLLLHPQYNHANLNNDVAIVRLSSPAVFSSTVQPISIAGTNYNVPDNTPVVTAGWGSQWYQGPPSQQLLHVTVNTINQQICAERYAYLKTLPGYQNWPDINNGMLCSGIFNVGGRDACQGDSGGPLVHNNVLLGVVSWGYQCADAFYPGVNARVPFFANWIVSNA
ncbi:unnamed protein product [Chrysodeixis includens]|uniref:Peptidase S1 domain-containing protein n=1 Tax=Chrysodeixis includens TaxID=689277 RepID=A0A9P0FPZ6_CHRIL|nr:unnamed protein product [Chrysodeixis includens]